MERDKRLDYPIDAASRILPEWGYIIAEANRGNNVAITLLMDLELALNSAGLTSRQRELLELHYLQDKQQEYIAYTLNTSQQSVSKAINKALEQVNDTYNKWGN